MTSLPGPPKTSEKSLPADDEVVALVTLEQVERSSAAADGVVAGAALHHVVTEQCR